MIFLLVFGLLGRWDIEWNVFIRDNFKLLDNFLVFLGLVSWDMFWIILLIMFRRWKELFKYVWKKGGDKVVIKCKVFWVLFLYMFFMIYVMYLSYILILLIRGCG